MPYLFTENAISCKKEPHPRTIKEAGSDNRRGATLDGSDAHHERRSSTDEFLHDLVALFSVRRYDLIRFLVRFGVSSSEAEDITQDVVLHMDDPVRNVKRPERLYDWLLTCARNLAITHLYRRRREPCVAECIWSKWERIIADPAYHTEADCLHRERCRRLIAAVAALDSKERQCILLRSDGLTFREIGEKLNIPLRRAVYLTNLAIEKLQAGPAPAGI